MKVINDKDIVLLNGIMKNKTKEERLAMDKETTDSWDYTELNKREQRTAKLIMNEDLKNMEMTRFNY